VRPDAPLGRPAARPCITSTPRRHPSAAPPPPRRRRAPSHQSTTLARPSRHVSQRRPRRCTVRPHAAARAGRELKGARRILGRARPGAGRGRRGRHVSPQPPSRDAQCARVRPRRAMGRTHPRAPNQRRRAPMPRLSPTRLSWPNDKKRARGAKKLHGKLYSLEMVQGPVTISEIAVSAFVATLHATINNDSG